MRTKYWMALPILLLALGCNFFDGPQVKSLCDTESTFTLTYGETGGCGDLTVSFTGDIQDSRCPETANCVWEGRVDVGVEVAGEPISLGLPDDAELGSSRDTIGNKVIELLEVLPYPVTTDPISKKEYQVKLEISDL